MQQQAKEEIRAHKRSWDPLSKTYSLKAKIYGGAFQGFSDFPHTIITQASRFNHNLARAAKQTGTERVSGTA